MVTEHILENTVHLQVAADARETLLSVRNLSKSFGRKQVIDDLSFDLNAGEVLGFLGPNGAGKTTTIKMIMGFLSLDRGTITICGKDHRREYEQAMAYIGGIVENPEMYFDLSGRVNLEMYRRLHPGVPKERIDEVISLVHMEKRANDLVKRYSLGMKQRICLAQALLHRPRVLVLDEPTNGLDPTGIRELRDLLRQLAHAENTAVLVSSHQLAEMQQMCDRVIIIDQGRLIDDQPISKLNQRAAKPRIDFRFPDPTARERAYELLDTNGPYQVSQTDDYTLRIHLATEQISEVIFRLSQAQIPLIAVTPESISLEDAYLHITGGGTNIE